MTTKKKGWKSPPGINPPSPLRRRHQGPRSIGSSSIGSHPAFAEHGVAHVRHKVGDRLAQRGRRARARGRTAIHAPKSCGCSRRARRNRSARGRRTGRPRRTRRRTCNGSLRRGRNCPAGAGSSRWRPWDTSRRTCRRRRTPPSARGGCRPSTRWCRPSAHVVVAARPHLETTDPHAAPAIDAAVGLAHDEVVTEVGRVIVGVAAMETVLEDLVLDRVPLQVALAVGRAVAVEAQPGAADSLFLGETELDLPEVGLAFLGRELGHLGGR